MIRRKLSSISTVFYKIIFPAVWIVGFGLGTIVLFMMEIPLPSGSNVLAGLRLGFLIVWILVSSFLLLLASRLRWVWLEGDYLIVRNYQFEDRVPMSAVRQVRETRTWRPKLIVVETDSTGGVSEQFTFAAPFSFQVLPQNLWVANALFPFDLPNFCEEDQRGKMLTGG